MSSEKKSYKETLNLPQTPFAMEAKLVQNEPKRLGMWQEARLYEKLMTSPLHTRGKWILHDGPPFANGDIHIGHVINKTLKDVFLRYKSMQGFHTPYVPGWDCHGLPIEHKIQEQLKKEGKNFRELSTVEVRRLCYAYAEKYVKVQAEQFQRLGILGEWQNPYLTLKSEYEAEVLEVFARFVEQGLVYKQLKPVPWSVASQTALADAELEYQDVVDTSVYVEFPIKQSAVDSGKSAVAESLLVWTTTPWTLPANLAVAINPGTEYAVVRYTREGVSKSSIVASALVEAVFKREDVQTFAIEKTIVGEELLTVEYRHPFIDRTGKVFGADYVTTTDGTGLVHTAPGHGEEDYETGMRNGLDIYSPVLANGRFDDTTPEFIRGKTTKEGNELIVAELKNRGVLFATTKITHSYPHDWRTKTPIIFRATEQWFVGMDRSISNVEGGVSSVEKRASNAADVSSQSTVNNRQSLREMALDAIGSKVKFVPDWGQHRIKGMLDSRPDWCISRQRAWGLPIPVFYNDKGDALLTPESVRAVAKHFREKGSEAWFDSEPAQLLGADFHYPPSFDAKTLRKEKDIFDVWFESGSSWQAVLKARSYLHFPADLYLEGSDQHRGWFQLSLLPSLGATGEPPFKQVLTHGFVVKPDGKKVSKSDKEYVTATQEIDRHGADLLRLWTCSVDYEGDIPTSPAVIKEFGDKYRKIRNTIRYLLSNLYDFDPRKDSQDLPDSSLDAWALYELDQLIEQVTAEYEAFHTHKAFKLLHDFCNVQLSAVYGNAMKDRMYCEAPTSKLRRRTQTVMYQMVVALTKMLAPMIVFTADETWEHLPHKPAGEVDLISVHLSLFPKPSGKAFSDEQKLAWKQIMDLRDEGLMQLDQLKKTVGLNKSVEAEVIYHVEDEATRRKLQAWGVDLADLVGAGYHSVVEKNDPAGPAIRIEVVDRRETYPACARSWKRRPDVGADKDYPDLCLRDALAVKARQV